MFQVTVGNHRVQVVGDGLSPSHGERNPYVELVDQFDLAASEGAFCSVSVGPPNGWPRLIVEQRYFPSVRENFPPGLLIVPETNLLFIGAGTRLLCYDLHGSKRLWQDSCECGFWGWESHKAFVLMSAELELAAWTNEGRKLWSRFVEPPWSYSASDDVVTVDVMGNVVRLNLVTGTELGVE